MTGVSPRGRANDRYRRHDRALLALTTLAAVWIGVRAPAVSPVAPPPAPPAATAGPAGNG